MLLVNQTAAYFLVWDGQINTNHHSTSANLLDDGIVFLHFLQLFYKIFSNKVGVFHESFLLENIKHS